MADEATWLILVSFEQESVKVTGYFIFGLNLKKGTTKADSISNETIA